MSHEASREQAIRRLMMAALDGEISPAEQAELDTILDEDAVRREEWQRMTRLKHVTAGMAFREPPPEVWGRFWNQVYNRCERGMGWILLSVGSIVLIGYGLWHLVEALWLETDLPGPIRLAIFAVLLGLLVLVVSVSREKLFTHRTDSYKGVER